MSTRKIKCIRAHCANTVFITLCVMLLLACTSDRQRTAPFRLRADGTVPGDLRGPFTGRVLDAATGNPVAGAIVYVSWTYLQNGDMAQPSRFEEALVSTNANGRYSIAKAPAASDRLTDVHLVVYKRGYVAYRSNRRFEDFGPRFDFAQMNNKVRLTRWRSEFSHARHVRFLGGGKALLTIASWEVDQAADELTQSGSERIATDLFVPRQGQVIAAQLLGENEIKEITGFDGKFDSGPLGGEPDTDRYSSQHFKAIGQPEVFDVALRMWKTDSKAAEERYDELIQTLPGVDQKDDIADRSFLATEGDIQGMAFLDRQRGIVVLLTCGKAQCSELAQLSEIAEKIYENIQAVAAEETTP